MVYTLVVHAYSKNDPDTIAKMKVKLEEAALVYSRDKECLSWFVMQETSDPTAFTIVERYENEGSQKYHLENPYWQTFNPYFGPLMDESRPLVLRRFEELLPDSAGEESRKFGDGVIPDNRKVEKDSSLWPKVAKHQSHLKEQGNY